MKSFFSFLFLLSVCFNLWSQDEIKPFSTFDIGIEFQAYPTGIMPGLRLETNVSSRSTIHLRLGQNIFDHKDFPKQAGINNHDSETGSGLGFSLGYKRYLKEDLSKLFVGVRTDFWFNQVDWSASEFTNCMSCDPVVITGRTDILVVQPTLEAGWLFLLGEKQHFFVTPEVAVGYEWNAVVNGQQTGYGVIALAGVHFGLRLGS